MADQVPPEIAAAPGQEERGQQFWIGGALAADGLIVVHGIFCFLGYGQRPGTISPEGRMRASGYRRAALRALRRTIGGTLQACFCNTSWSAEINAQGSAFALPAGDAKVALGGGIRSNSLRAKRTLSSPLDFDVTQDVYYAFGEVNVPLISPDMQLTGIRKLSATAAVRYESYSGLESLATPKFGINYVPVDGLEIKATWGKAFKAATLLVRE
ncbi:TonB-dependent receptor domain-containing protein [Psychrobacter sp. R4_3_1_2]|uniref:TonB-dependent receptor-like beta-barrel domain-containing protein n=1 Tax=Novosphingobium pentaromativorans TaxID=205844 RepID=A0A2W5NBN6_9SPHN|nr:MAG: hypothetical protein DI555_22225 [Novosphingobium pentaromativorans]